MITEEDILDCIEPGDLVRLGGYIVSVFEVHCNCNPEYWKTHFHTGDCICEYEPRKKGFNHTKRITEVFKRNGKNYVCFAHKKNEKLILDKEVEEE